MRKSTRSDIASFSTVYRDTGRAYRELGAAVWEVWVRTLLIPVHLLLWLWLPELSADEKAQREAAAKEWADADV